ncbi:helicase, partial [Candidatus Saccharibacteria bacterium]|nr:helicase [Candidatus Saccharibacteria bacterium]
LACTATPAPNDHLELGNHAEFLGVMKSSEMIQRWFKNDTMQAGGYALKAHGADDFWAWVASWAVALRWPSDIGQYNDDGYILPELIFEPHIIKVDHSRAWDEVDDRGQASLLITGRTSATNMHKEKRATLKQRMAKAAELALYASAEDYVIVWCETNAEADELRRLLPDAVEVRGNEPLDMKRKKLEDFSDGKIRLLITKPKIAAHGLNWQHAGTQIWTSITHKFEPFYQGYKRSHRFGRTEPVTCHIVYAESEGDILENLTGKHEAHVEMQTRMVEAMQQNGMSLEIGGHLRIFTDNARVERGQGWTIYNGDSAVALQNEPDNSLDFIVQSPPFESIYIYSSHVEDLGNSTNHDQFYHQYGYILRDELRRLKPGSYKAEHCKDLPLYRGRDGAMGLDDFPGRLITAHLEAGFWF